MASSLDRSTHFIVGESTLDEIPDQWLIQYYEACLAMPPNKSQMVIVKQLTGLSHSELVDLYHD